MDKPYRKKRSRPSGSPREVKGDKAVLDRPIDGIGLPPDTLELLKNNGFGRVYDIASRTEHDMFRVQTFNKKHLAAVKKAVNAVGIDFLPPAPPREDASKKPPEKARDGRKKQEDARRGTKGRREDRKPAQDAKPAPRRPEKKPRVLLPLEEWPKVQKNGKWGFGNGLKVVIEPRFDEVFFFKDGVACVEEDGKFGYIDEKGEYVIEPKFECAMSFSEGRAVFFEGEKCGYIDKEGNVAIPAKYDAATAFENGHAKVKDFGKWHTIDMDDTILW